MKNTKRFIIFLCLTIFWIMFIFSFSMQTGEQSSQISGGIVSQVLAVFGLGDFVYADILETVIRKIAHFSEYTVLGILASLMIRETNCKRPVLSPWVIGALVACCDETIQLFSNGRSGQVTDVMLDSAGVLFGCVVVWKFFTRYAKDDKNVPYTNHKK